MGTLTRVGAREFREELADYLDSQTPVAITRHGQIVGYYIPAHGEPERQELRALLDAVGKMEALLVEHGVSEDEVVREFQSRRANA